MSEIIKTGQDFVGYEYKDLLVSKSKAAMYLDCYQNFGWFQDQKIHGIGNDRQVSILLKRDRRLVNRTELTRLQRNFEAVMAALEATEKESHITAMVAGVAVGGLGTIFMAGSVFAVTATTPNIPLTILFGCLGFLGWGAAYFVTQHVESWKKQKLAERIEAAYEEIYQVCEKGAKLTHRTIE